MTAYLPPILYAVFVWWFATGAVLLLVGRGGPLLKLFAAVALAVAGLSILALATNVATVGGAYAAFTGTILLWGAQEIAFLAGWATGPKPQPCPPNAMGLNRLRLALQAILYHELVLLACGGAVVMLAWGATDPVGIWTFLALWVLRQSAKINLFLGVPVTNDELIPAPVQFLTSFFRRGPVSGFFPLSVAVATGALALMIQRLAADDALPFETAGLTLVAALFALGIVEHVFMLLPLPAVTLWGWGLRPVSPEGIVMPDSKPASPPSLVPFSDRPEAAANHARPDGARQRLEDEFRRHFREQTRGLATAGPVDALQLDKEPATPQGRPS